MSTYLFDNAGQQAGQRFSSLETLYDPWTIRHPEAPGIGAGWQASSYTKRTDESRWVRRRFSTACTICALTP